VDTDVEIAVRCPKFNLRHWRPRVVSVAPRSARHGGDGPQGSHGQRQSRHHVALTSSHGYSRDLGGGSLRPMRAYDKSTDQRAYAYSPLKGLTEPLTAHHAEIPSARTASQIGPPPTRPSRYRGTPVYPPVLQVVANR
jgi:hypothetical protein